MEEVCSAWLLLLVLERLVNLWGRQLGSSPFVPSDYGFVEYYHNTFLADQGHSDCDFDVDYFYDESPCLMDSYIHFQ